METARSELQITFLELGWEDTTSWTISDADLVQCVRFIHAARRAGGSVLVHCAQVRGAVVGLNSLCQSGQLPLLHNLHGNTAYNYKTFVNYIIKQAVSNPFILKLC